MQETLGPEATQSLMDETPVALIERRTHPRVRLELRCYKRNGEPGAVAARTINVSRTGALLLWNRTNSENAIPAVGASLNVDLELPPSSRGRKYIRCRGRVVRIIDVDTKSPLVAVSIAHMTFSAARHAAKAPRETTPEPLEHVAPKTMHAGASGSHAAGGSEL